MSGGTNCTNKQRWKSTLADVESEMTARRSNIKASGFSFSNLDYEALSSLTKLQLEMVRAVTEENGSFLADEECCSTEIAGIAIGDFPIDTQRPILLEIPEGGKKKHISGRFPGGLTSSVRPARFDELRLVHLPIYKNWKTHQRESLTSVKDCNCNKLPFTVPTITLAGRYDGYYCDQRRAQAVSVFPIWPDGTSVLLELDWYEGPLEDCITPEWHLQVSPHHSIIDGLQRLRRASCNPPMWEACYFYLYINPPFLGSYLLGKGSPISSQVWQQEWKYQEHREMLDALDQVIAFVSGLDMDEINNKSNE